MLNSNQTDKRLLPWLGGAMFLLLASGPLMAADDAEDAELKALKEQTRESLEQAQRELVEAEEHMQAQAREAAAAAREAARESSLSEEDRKLVEKEMQHAREELVEAQREMRDKSRRMAEVQRELAREQRRMGREQRVEIRRQRSQVERQRNAESYRFVRASSSGVIGVILGDQTKDGGIRVIGLTPDGPAERAGVRQGDVIVGINGTMLRDADTANGTLREVMLDVEPGDDVVLDYLREGEAEVVTLEAVERAPITIHSVMTAPTPPSPPNAASFKVTTIPGSPDAPDAPEAPRIVIERIEAPDVTIDMDEFNNRMAELEEQLESGDWAFGSPTYKFRMGPEDREIHFSEFSNLASEAFNNAFVWFGGEHLWRGLELSPMNPGLAQYFDTETGVLVVRADEDNQLGLASGDVILAIAGTDVGSPGDVIRALREAEPQQQLDLDIMRRGKSQNMSFTVPEPSPEDIGFNYSIEWQTEDELAPHPDDL